MSKTSDHPQSSPVLDDWTRRQFLNRTLLGTSAISAGLTLGASPPTPAASATSGGDKSKGADGRPRIRRRVQLGRSGVKIPDISFGSFSLEHDESLIHHALDRGVTHFDTAESYTEGRAEEVLGRALRGHRHQVTITSKFWATPESSADHQMAILEKSLRRLQTDYVDIYLNHAVNDVARLSSPEWLTFLDRAKQQGKIRAAGISGHAGRLTECLEYALDHDLIDVVLAAYNFAQQPSYQQRLKQAFKDLGASFDLVTTHPQLPQLLARTHAAGVGVMVMKTLKGARRNDIRPFESTGRTFAQSAFRWVLSDPSVDGVVVSMTSSEMIDEYVEASGSGPPDDEDLALLARYDAINAGRSCQVGCDACVGTCPATVPIADVMRVRMYDRDYGVGEVAKREYAALSTNAAVCLACDGAPCAGACPNSLQISALNRDTHRRLA